MARTVRRALGSLLVIGLSGGVLLAQSGFSPAGATSSSAHATSSIIRAAGSSTPATGPAAEQEPTRADLERQQAKVAELRATAQRQAADLENAE